MVPPPGGITDLKNAPAPAGVDPQVWAGMNEDERATVVRAVGTPAAARPGGVSPGALTAKPETIRAYNGLTDILHQLASPDIAATFPREAEAREFSRAKAMSFDKAVANFIDPPKAEAVRKLADSAKIMIDRLESGGVPRNQAVINAVEGLLGGIRDRSITREQYVERLVALTRLIKNYDPTTPLQTKEPPSEEEIRGGTSPDVQQFLDRVRRGEFTARGGPAGSATSNGNGNGAARATGATLKNLEAQLLPLVKSGKMTKAQAVQRLRAAAAAGLPME
jgi:hypothetical protein